METRFWYLAYLVLFMVVLVTSWFVPVPLWMQVVAFSWISLDVLLEHHFKGDE